MNRYDILLGKSVSVMVEKASTLCDKKIFSLEERLIRKAEKCLEIVENFDIDPDSDDLKEECATSLMFCSEIYLDKMLKIF